MFDYVKPGELFRLADLLPYESGKISRIFLADTDHVKIVLAACDAGTAFPEIPAKGTALIFALDGEGVIGYAGKEHTLKAGDNFAMEKGVLHSIRAISPFKMAVVLLQE